MERPVWLLTVKFNSCNNLYHPFILIVSFCVLSSLIMKHENIIKYYIDGTIRRRYILNSIFFIYIYIYSASATIIKFKYIKTQYIFIKITSFSKVVIMLQKFDSNSEHTFFYPAWHFRPFTQNCILRQAPHFERAPHICPAQTGENEALPSHHSN